MSIMPAGGWGNKPLEGQVVRPSPEPKQTVVIVRREKGAAFNNSFSGCLGAVCAFFVVIFVLGFIARLGGSDTAPQMTKSAETVHVPAVELNAAYKANEVAADSEYSGKTLYVTGRVKSINKDAWDEAYLSLADGDYYRTGSFLGVQATLQKDSATLDEARELSIGDDVAVICTDVQYVVGSVMLKDCKFGTDAVPQSNQSAPASATSPENAANQQDYMSEAKKIWPLMDKDYRDHPADGEGGNLLPPRLLHSASLTYPVDALPTGISGIVTVGATVGTDGSLSNIHIVKSVSPALDTAALQAFSTNQFEPARNSITNAPVASDVTQNLNFTPPQPVQTSHLPNTQAPALIVRQSPANPQ